MRRNKYVLWTIGVLALLFVFWFFYLRTARENRLMKEGSILVKKIEIFKAEHKRLPNSLEEIGMEERDGIDALYYSKKDSTHYIVWFGMDLSESITYYSDSKQWEDRDRGME